MKGNTDQRETEIITALMSGWRVVTIEGIEIVLKPLKRDTKVRQRKEAKQRAKDLIKLLD